MTKIRPAQFDPFGWSERLLSPRQLHLLIRAAAVAVLAVFLVHRLGQFRVYFFKPLWVVETLIFAVFIIAYAIRANPVDRSRGAKEILVPLVGAVLPFALLLSPPADLVARIPLRAYFLFSWMTLSTAFTVWGLWSLRRSFSITVEARNVVTSGPYRRIRHPVYLGEIMTAAAVMIWRWSTLNLTVFAVFTAVQLLRARWEEEKLCRVLPGYRPYASNAWWFWRSGKVRRRF